MQIRNRTFVVSGGASGLGLATAQALHAKGAYIAILDLNEDAGTQAATELCNTALHSDANSDVSSHVWSSSIKSICWEV